MNFRSGFAVDDSTINIVLVVIIIIFFYPRYQCSRGRFEKIRENEKAGYV